MARFDARRRRRLIPLLGVAGLSLVLACNGIIGIDQFHRADCPGAICTDAQADATPDTGPGLDGGADVVTVDATALPPVSWARWPMPNYDAGGTTDNPNTYAPAGAAKLQDTVTKLTWLEPVPTPNDFTNKTHADAVKTCAAQPNGPWRLPSRIELASLLDLSRTPKVDAKFASMTANAYWTSSPARPASSPLKYWVVSFDTGEISRRDETQTASVRCVLGGT